MKRQLLILIAILVLPGTYALAQCCPAKGDCATCAPEKTAVGKKAAAPSEDIEISTSVLKVLIGSGVPITILDARSGKWDDGRRVPGASGLRANSSKKAIRKALPSKDRLIVTYCSNLKCPASSNLAGRLRKLGYSHVLEYPYGIDGWAKAGNEIVSAK